MNFLEQLVAEWYEYQGYFVRSNTKFGKRDAGGYKGEIDVAAFHPQTGEFVHIETSSDADSWAERKDRFQRKFRDAADHYDELFPFAKQRAKRIAVVGGSTPREKPDFGMGIEVMSIPDLVAQIGACFRSRHPMSEAAPEGLPLLRAIQFAVNYCR